ncbi:toxin co-regulated pilus biosynthesis Q family protein [Burkholderia ubonensis]|uniref:toxin co-regulated pilus biosynthesis Q family protein n=1 Tax=Burkholderia ubonensis TaxID=101571 RepID=UPI00075CE65C|nr:toxin co-regulated pilus biosynthesis Q family protein [Burkholderia ubonensis]KWB60458.1 pili assembly chaperone [Burkholderia ubonensis]KWB63196.1 pili assembly chaperone [Burkholderia ubonensis]KWI37720.1 pili assembly chaperone [Burkholderia ubonensis]OJB21156.1 pili assembly chaperone [Burkholderia ubonensis]OJB40145.1 pili assembly chaperone [Burkholderia ubonensis]
MMHGATVAAAAFIALALSATDCAASGPPAGTDPAPGGPFAERFDHAPLTAQRGDVFRAPASAAAAPGAPAVPAPAVPAAALPAAAPVPAASSWDVRASDGTIRGVLSRWARTAGWQLVWDAPVDFSVDAQATLRGSFEDALQALVASLGRTSTPIQAILYQGNHVLRVVAQGAG